MRRRAPLLLVAILAACGGPPAPTEQPMEEPMEEPTPVATPEPSVQPLTATDEPLPAGTYTRVGFEPAITVTIEDATWQAVQLFEGFFDIQHDVGSPDVIAVQFARVTGVYGASGAAQPADPDEAVELLSGNPNLTVVETSASAIGGLDGSQVTVENAGDEHASVVAVPPGPLGIDPGRRLWLAFFKTDAGLLAIMVGGSTDRWDEALSLAESVLESVEIGP
jgi:hypothetical protein